MLNKRNWSNSIERAGPVKVEKFSLPLESESALPFKLKFFHLSSLNTVNLIRRCWVLPTTCSKRLWLPSVDTSLGEA